ncbi:MAG: hypothetical protein ACK5CQ_14125, partial [Cyanobacteriota bacterium]
STAAEVSAISSDLAADQDEAEVETIPLPLTPAAEVVTVEMPDHRRGTPRSAQDSDQVSDQVSDQAGAETAEEGAEDQEPRRRRRRSSATV